jgi:hypothetical protein
MAATDMQWHVERAAEEAAGHITVAWLICSSTCIKKAADRQQGA